MLQLLEDLLSGAANMEGRYIAAIALLDQAETLMNTGAANDEVPPEVALKVGVAKQAVIEAFADTNRRTTLASMQEKATQQPSDE